MPFLQIYGVGGNLSDEAFRKVEGKGDGGGGRSQQERVGGTITGGRGTDDR